MLVTSLSSAAALPNAASIRCTNSTQKWYTYTVCATIRPMYSGSCSQRLAKISFGSGGIGLFNWVMKRSVTDLARQL